VSTPTVLISGASVAGPMLAHWLAEAGWSTTVVERYDGLRDAGHNVDIRGAAREVLRRTGIEDEVLAAGTGEEGLRFVDEDGAEIATFPAEPGDVGGPTAEAEILRGELARILYERTAGATEYVFGDEITGLPSHDDRAHDDKAHDDRAHDDGVDVTFRRGAARSFDVVVIAEGLTSRTRALVMPDARIHDLGLYTAYLTIPRRPDDDRYWRWYNAPGGRTLGLRPDNVGTTRALLSFTTGVRGLEELGLDEQRLVLRRTFADAGWQAPRILGALDDGALHAAPLYLDLIGQMRLPRWHAGRVGLVGDAAYCPSPLSGMGTSCALVGAYVLAQELAAHGPDRAEEAFAAYDARLRPYVERAQRIAPGAPGLAHPRTRAGVTVLRRAAALVGSRPFRALTGVLGHLGSAPAEDIELLDQQAVPPRGRTAA
jgi:2-polyprenyl-6-methoxyphenol hydroxylase-like FAD-dependent oxidoreductase